jgi:hypothetical protein
VDCVIILHNMGIMYESILNFVIFTLITLFLPLNLSIETVEV